MILSRQRHCRCGPCGLNAEPPRLRRRREGSHIDSIASCPCGQDKFMDERDEPRTRGNVSRCPCCAARSNRSRCGRLRRCGTSCTSCASCANSTSRNHGCQQNRARNRCGSRRQAGRWRCRSGRPPDSRSRRPAWSRSRCIL